MPPLRALRAALDRLLSFWEWPGMPPERRLRHRLLAGVMLTLVGLMSLLATANFLGGFAGTVGRANLVFLCIGAAALVLLRLRFTQGAAVFFVVCGTAVAATSGILYRSGSQFFLLVGVGTALLSFESKLWRRIFSATTGVLFIAIETYHEAHPAPSVFPPARYAVNLALFIVVLYSTNAVFRALHRRALATIGEKNAELERQRLLLEAEHAKLQEQSARLNEANAAKERLFSIIGHDLRGPVGAVKHALTLMDDGALTQTEFADLRRDLHRGVDNVHSSLENLMEWGAAQLGSLRPRPARVPFRQTAATAARLLSGLAADKGIAVHNALPEGAAVTADVRQLEAIFRNLLSNAIKFTPPGGRVDLAAREEGGRWRITVRDTGVGMTPERAAALFLVNGVSSTPGTADEQGLGLGLQICRDFACANGGEIAAESAPGAGSAFHLLLPRSD